MHDCSIFSFFIISKVSVCFPYKEIIMNKSRDDKSFLSVFPKFSTSPDGRLLLSWIWLPTFLLNTDVVTLSGSNYAI